MATSSSGALAHVGPVRAFSSASGRSSRQRSAMRIWFVCACAHDSESPPGSMGAEGAGAARFLGAILKMGALAQRLARHPKHALSGSPVEIFATPGVASFRRELLHFDQVLPIPPAPR